MAASRLPLWHRLFVILLILGVSATILAWGYVLNVGTLVVHLQPGDALRVDGDPLPADGRVRAGVRRIEVQRPHYVTFSDDVTVLRDKTTEVTPILEFIPYMPDLAKTAVSPLLTVTQQSATYREQPGSLAQYPATTLRLLQLDSRDRVTNLIAAPDWSRVWVALEGGEEAVRTPSGDVLWSGTSVGRAFAGTRFVFAARTAAGGVVLNRLEDGGERTGIGVLEGSGTFSLVPSPDGERILAIDDTLGGATIVSASGRERLELEHVALDAQWSPDGKTLLLQVRMKGATAGTRLALYDIASGVESLLELRSAVSLATFSDDGKSLYAIERQATSSISQEELSRQLADPRVQELADQVQQKVLDFIDFQDAIPSDVGVSASLVRLDVGTMERSTIPVNGLKLTSETLKLERGTDSGTLLILGPDAIRTVILRDSSPVR